MGGDSESTFVIGVDVGGVSVQFNVVNQTALC